MTDRELLELAAKAAGHPIDFSDALNFSGSPRYFNNDNGEFWNPLTADGDALRLAVALEMEIRQVHFSAHAGQQDRFWQTERRGDDPCAATRRAIVRAAAEIGKGIEVTHDKEKRDA